MLTYRVSRYFSQCEVLTRESSLQLRVAVQKGETIVKRKRQSSKTAFKTRQPAPARNAGTSSRSALSGSALEKELDILQLLAVGYIHRFRIVNVSVIDR
jgi:hypothetical protein